MSSDDVRRDAWNLRLWLLDRRARGVPPQGIGNPIPERTQLLYAPVLAPPFRPPKPNRKGAACGTEAGWMRHHRRKEEKCDACKLARNDAKARREALRKGSEWLDGGGSE